MFSLSSAQLPCLASRRGVLPFLGLLGLGLPALLGAQAGSVPFTVHSFEKVADATVEAAFPALSSLRVMPFATTSAAPVDYLLLTRFTSVGEFDPDADPDAEERVRVHLVAEYDAYHKATDTYRESGLLAFTLASDSDVGASGDNIVGFIRHGAVPSSLPRGATPGYLDGLRGDLSWDYFAASRSGYIVADGAAYAPGFVHEDYVSLLTSGRTASINLFLPPVAGSGDLRLQWWLGLPLVRPLQDRATRSRQHYYAIGDRVDGLSAADLLLDDGDPANDLVPASFGPPWQVHNKLYVLRLHDLRDSDGDGVPDFLDLTTTVETMPSYADAWGVDNWYYSYFLQDWVYSTRLTDWDYTLKFGWIYTVPGVQRDNFWFYGAAPEFGWMWTKVGLFPTFYRHRDNTWLQWTPRPEGAPAMGQSLFYNWNTGAYETISF
jgi:hypothetical protein